LPGAPLEPRPANVKKRGPGAPGLETACLVADDKATVRRIGKLLLAGTQSLLLVGGFAMLQAIAVAGLMVVHHGSTGTVPAAAWLVPVIAGGAIVTASIAICLWVLGPARAGVLRQSGRLHALYDYNVDMVAYYDRSGTVLHANAAAVKWFGREGNQIGNSFEQHIAPAERANAALHFTRALGGAESAFETAFVRSDGKLLPIIANLQPVIVDGNVVGVYGIAKDLAKIRGVQDELQRGEQRFRSIFEYFRDAAIAVDRNGVLLRVNPAMERLTGYREEELLRTPIARLMPPGGLEEARDVLRTAFKGESSEFDAELLRKDGTLCEVHVQALPMIEAGAVTGAFGFIKDISEQRALEARLAQRDGRMRSLYMVASSPEADANAQINEALSVGCLALGLQCGFVTHLTKGAILVRNRFGEGDDCPLGLTMPASQPIGRRILGEQNGVAVPDLTIEPWSTDLGRANLSWKSFIAAGIMVENAYYGTLLFTGNEVRSKPFEQADLDFIDLMSTVVGSALLRERRHVEMRDLAFRDPLTGLANRALFEEHVQRAIAVAQRSNGDVVLHYIDLDRFKPINDTYGHAAGDEVLCEIARRLVEAVRDQDIVARVGGDEFVVLQSGVGLDAAMRAMARRLARSIREPILLSSGPAVSVGASLGMAVYPVDAHDGPSLLRFADADMYRAKEASQKAIRTIAVH
jgi:diguanylate cyclase (GGDEF)-like protein/PAS domain S-box-containing protein